jgi:hypothetical protein
MVTVAVIGAPGAKPAPLRLTVVTRSAGVGGTLVTTGPPMLSLGSRSTIVGGRVATAVFCQLPEPGAVAVIRIVAWALAGKLLRVMLKLLPLPEAGVQVTPLVPAQVQLTPVSTAGTLSAMTVPSAAAGPLLVTTIV